MLGVSCNMALVPAHPVYLWTFAAQCCFYAAALFAPVFPGARMARKLLGPPHAFVVMNAAALVGLYRFVRGTQRVTWDRVGSRQ